jgi:hypothetical protein
VVHLKRQENWDTFTITPEFGPFPYMTILPYSKEPITNQWEANLFMMNYLKANLD